MKDDSKINYLAWLGFIGAIIIFIVEKWDEIPKPPKRSGSQQQSNTYRPDSEPPISNPG
jgi:hypothetical protein